MDAMVEQVRSFNRTVTSAVGALDDHFLGRDRPLGQARLLWEIGANGADVRELRRRLGLDSGYASRLLRSLERAGLVHVTRDPADSRRRRVVLMDAGRAERAELDRRARDLAGTLLQPLSAQERRRLVASMRDVERLLMRARTTIGPESVGSPDVRWCFGRYVAELDQRFETGFDVGRSMPADASDLTPPRGLVLMARLDNDPVGCGALKLHDEAIAELKRMWVAPRVRGFGLGRRMLQALEQEARQRGVERLRLETNHNLVEAIAFYRRSGYREVEPFSDEPYAQFWFEKALALRAPHHRRPDDRPKADTGHDLERVRSRAK
jgi:DNA-binding MarR family transcriptional regulator/GNAT superfamily N-acetyltransferase